MNRAKRAMRESAMLAYRVRILPEQLQRARDRYRGLQREAIRLGMLDLLNDPDASSKALEAEIAALRSRNDTQGWLCRRIKKLTPRDLAYQSQMAAANEIFVARLLAEFRMISGRRRQESELRMVARRRRQG